MHAQRGQDAQRRREREGAARRARQMCWVQAARSRGKLQYSIEDED